MNKTVRPRLSQEAYEALERMQKYLDAEDKSQAIQFASMKIGAMEVTALARNAAIYKLRKKVKMCRIKLYSVVMLGCIGWLAAAVFAFM